MTNPIFTDIDMKDNLVLFYKGASLPLGKCAFVDVTTSEPFVEIYYELVDSLGARKSYGLTPTGADGKIRIVMQTKPADAIGMWTFTARRSGRSSAITFPVSKA